MYKYFSKVWTDADTKISGARKIFNSKIDNYDYLFIMILFCTNQHFVVVIVGKIYFD